MATQISKIDSVSSFFSGQGDILLFAAISDADYATADLADLLTPSSLGDIFEGSTSWNGDDVSFENINNEQGNAVTTKTVMGSYGYEFTHMSVTPARLAVFMAGTTLANPGTLPAWLGSSPTPDVTGFGHEPAVIVRPIALLDETKTKWLIFPKAKIATSITMDGTNIMLKSIVSAESLNTTTLKTILLVNGVPVYQTA